MLPASETISLTNRKRRSDSEFIWYRIVLPFPSSGNGDTLYTSYAVIDSSIILSYFNTECWHNMNILYYIINNYRPMHYKYTYSIALEIQLGIICYRSMRMCLAAIVKRCTFTLHLFINH